MAQQKAHLFVLPSLDLAKEVDLSAVMDAAAQQVRVASITKCESLLAQTLARASSKKTQERLTQFTAACSAEIKGSWDAEGAVHPELVELTKSALSGDGEKPGAKRDKAEKPPKKQRR